MIISSFKLQADPVYNHQGQPQNHMPQMQPRPVQTQAPPAPQQMHYQQAQQVLFHFLILI